MERGARSLEPGAGSEARWNRLRLPQAEEQGADRLTEQTTEAPAYRTAPQANLPCSTLRRLFYPRRGCDSLCFASDDSFQCRFLLAVILAELGRIEIELLGDIATNRPNFFHFQLYGFHLFSETNSKGVTSSGVGKPSMPLIRRMWPILLALAM